MSDAKKTSIKLLQRSWHKCRCAMLLFIGICGVHLFKHGSVKIAAVCGRLYLCWRPPGALLIPAFLLTPVVDSESYLSSSASLGSLRHEPVPSGAPQPRHSSLLLLCAPQAEPLDRYESGELREIAPLPPGLRFSATALPQPQIDWKQI